MVNELPDLNKTGTNVTRHERKRAEPGGQPEHVAKCKVRAKTSGKQRPFAATTHSSRHEMVAQQSGPPRTGHNIPRRGIVMAKMLGRIHEPHCDCNIEWVISGADEKCNHRYGVKRQRAKEKREWQAHENE